MPRFVSWQARREARRAAAAGLAAAAAAAAGLAGAWAAAAGLSRAAAVATVAAAGAKVLVRLRVSAFGGRWLG